ncbi:hypothetical protein BX667DRAFT_502868 [Coemansia mojavensis]|nr:hypothetical protein BX667DRAFT_502868 [Coemansia mojavensis]
MRDMLRKHGFTVYLIDAYHTSSLCPLCFSPTEMLFKRPSPKPSKNQGKEPDKEPKQHYCHCLLRCTECTVELEDRIVFRKWNRDLAAACSLCTILQSIREGKGVSEQFNWSTEGIKHRLAESSSESSKAKREPASKIFIYIVASVAAL